VYDTRTPPWWSLIPRVELHEDLVRTVTRSATQRGIRTFDTTVGKVTFALLIELTMANDSGVSAREKRERKMHLEALERDTPKAWRELRTDYKIDKEFILKALQSPRLPNKSEFERLFPQYLRFDRDVVLAFCGRNDFKEIYYDRHLFVPGCLTGDKEVMLAYCRQIPRSLQECSPELCDDREVVEAAISFDGLELQYASNRLQEDRDIVVAACQNNGQALELCPPGKVRDELTGDRDFMLSVLRMHGGPMLRLVSDPLRNDRELLLEALKHGMRYRYCPFDFHNDKVFVHEALTRRATLYLEMNRTSQMDVDLAQAAIVSATSTPEVHDKALGHHPDLTRFRNVGLALAQRGEVAKLGDYLLGHSHRSDREIMLAAVTRNPKLFSRINPVLQRDLEVVMAAIHRDTAMSVLNTVGPTYQELHPEVTVGAITEANMSNLRLMQSSIPNSLWTNFDVAVAWMQRIHRIPSGSTSLLTNRDFALQVARYAHRQFNSVAERLRQDSVFMTEAVDINGFVLRYAAPELRRDLNLVVRAVASNRNSLGPSIPITLAQVRTHVESKLELHRSFLNDFLRGIAVSTPHLPPPIRSQLPLLDRGVETSQAFKQLVAQFLGVPVGAELTLLRRAWNKLQDNSPEDRPAEADEPFVDILEDGGAAALPAVMRRLRQRRMWHHMREQDGDEQAVAGPRRRRIGVAFGFPAPAVDAQPFPAGFGLAAPGLAAPAGVFGRPAQARQLGAGFPFGGALVEAPPALGFGFGAPPDLDRPAQARPAGGFFFGVPPERDLARPAQAQPGPVPFADPAPFRAANPGNGPPADLAPFRAAVRPPADPRRLDGRLARLRDAQRERMQHRETGDHERDRFALLMDTRNRARLPNPPVIRVPGVAFFDFPANRPRDEIFVDLNDEDDSVVDDDDDGMEEMFRQIDEMEDVEQDLMHIL
jgi:hypothetical protein